MKLYIKKPGRRLLMFFSIGLIISLVTGFLSSFFAYFKTGADWYASEDFLFGSLAPYSAEINWLPDDLHEGARMSSYLRAHIGDAYSIAWLTLNQSQKTGNVAMLKDHFSEIPRSEIESMMALEKDFFVEQADLSHHIQLHLLSLDKQIVSFTDHQVLLKKRIYHKASMKPLVTDQQVSSFKVVMTLDDEKWRIRHFMRIPPNSHKEILKRKNFPKDSTCIHLEKGSFVDNGKPFKMAGVNYYPKEQPWFGFWENFDSCLLVRDLPLIKELNLNTLRIFVPYTLFGQGEVKAEMLDKLEITLDLSERHGIKVLVTLFDFPVGYALGDYAPTERHLKTILNRFQNHPGILAWDLKNEADLDFGNYGEKQVKEWLDYMIGRAREYDPNHLITLGWAYSDNASLFKDEVDFVSFHCYTKPGNLKYRLENLQKEVGEKPIVISEFGLSTYQSLFVKGGNTEKEQVSYYENVIEILKEKGDVPFIAWTLYDFDKLPDNVFDSRWWVRIPQKNFGLFRKNGKPKKVCTLLKAGRHL